MVTAHDPLAMHRFENALLTAFTVSTLCEDGTNAPLINLVLVELSSRGAIPGYEQYAALFQGPAEPVVPQGTYQFRHALLGELTLFMVPVRGDRERVQYEVCVSRKLATQ